jgi:hypothetical protein
MIFMKYSESAMVISKSGWRSFGVGCWLVDVLTLLADTALGLGWLAAVV